MKLVRTDWSSVADVIGSMVAVLHRAKRSWVRVTLEFVLPFATGAALAFFLLDPAQPGKFSADASKPVESMIVLGTVLAGFMITLMLFTGKIDQSDDVGYEILVAVTARIRWLLVSQAMTLFSSLGLTLAAVIWLVLRGIGVENWASVVTWLAMGGLGAVCLVRLFVVPFQIYELHDFSLQTALEQSRKRAAGRS